jgi:predicted enzyme related to lactoylglutathione lyase
MSPRDVLGDATIGSKEATVNFNSILIGSEDPERLVGYYKRLLGEPVFSGEGYTAWMVGSGAITVGPHSQVKGRNAAPGRLIWNIESDDVKGDFARFEAAGATIVQAPYEFEPAPGTWIATFEDPDGNYFQLVSPMNPAEMGG